MDTILLGADIGGTKTRVLIADGTGRTLGRGEAGPGNHEVVGYDGMAQAIRDATSRALADYNLATSPALPQARQDHDLADRRFLSNLALARLEDRRQAARLDRGRDLKLEDVSAAGLGVAGYDWPSQRQRMLDVLAELGFSMPLEIVNDAILGLLAGSQAGWGLAVIAGTSCNCWGWDRTRQRVGHTTGGGWMMGEHAGGSELVQKAIQAMAYEWTRRGSPTALTPLFVARAGADNLESLIEGLMTGKYHLDASAARLVFKAAAAGDPVAEDLARWAGKELGELANAVIRQLGFEELQFDVVQMGSLWKGSPLLSRSMQETVHACAPGARLVRLRVPPVNGAIVLAGQVAESIDKDTDYLGIHG